MVQKLSYWFAFKIINIGYTKHHVLMTTLALKGQYYYYYYLKNHTGLCRVILVTNPSTTNLFKLEKLVNFKRVFFSVDSSKILT